MKTKTIMNRLYALIILVLSTTIVTCQPLPEWTSQIETYWSNAGVSNKPKLKFDNEGNLILGCTKVDPGTWIDYLIVKYDIDGNIIWQNSYNGQNNMNDYLYDFCVDNQNNIYVTGHSHIDSLNSQIVTIKYSPSGNLLWKNTYDGIADRTDVGRSIAVDSDLNTYVTGLTMVDSVTNKRLIVLKIDSSGNQIWSKVLDSQYDSRYEGMKIKIIDNQVQVLGRYVKYNKDSESGCVILKLSLSGSIMDSYEAETNGWLTYYLDDFGNSYVGGWGSYEITKVSSSGIIQWTDLIATNLPPNVSGDEVRAITVDGDKNVYITGRHYGDDYGGQNYSNADILTIKYDSSGNKLWQSRYEYLGNNAADIGNAIAIDDYFNVYIGGQSQAIIAGEDYDYIVLKYDSDGQEIGTIRYDDENGEDDAVTSVIVSDTNCVYVTGHTLDFFILTHTTTQKYSDFVLTNITDLIDYETLPVYPNPTSSTITIELPTQPSTNTTLTISHTNGQQLITQPITKSQSEIDIGHLPNGIYIIKVWNDKNVMVQKIVKQ